MFGGCTEGVRKVFGGCTEGVQKVYGRRSEVLRGCAEGVRKYVFNKCLTKSLEWRCSNFLYHFNALKRSFVKANTVGASF